MTVRYRISHTRTKYTKYGIYAELNSTKYYTDFIYSISINYVNIKQLEMFVRTVLFYFRGRYMIMKQKTEGQKLMMEEAESS
jgi:hypothetical protein